MEYLITVVALYGGRLNSVRVSVCHVPLGQDSCRFLAIVSSTYHETAVSLIWSLSGPTTSLVLLAGLVFSLVRLWQLSLRIFCVCILLPTILCTRTVVFGCIA